MTLSIAIAGCGIGGLTAALLLHRAGHRVEIFERFAAPTPVGSGLVIQPVGQRVLEGLGLLKNLCDRGARIYRMQGHDAKSLRQVLDAAYGPVGGPDFGLALHRTTLFDALHSAACAEAIEIHCDAAVDDLSDGPRRRLTLASGAVHGPFDLVIDAAGAGTPLAPRPGRALGYGALWGTVDLPDGFETQELRQRYRGAHTMLGILPVGRPRDGDSPRASIFYSLPQAAYPDWRASPLQHWKDKASTLWPAYGSLLDQITAHDQLAMARYRHGTLKNPIAPGLAHIGDAAHLASPQLGQGANMALLDAEALARAVIAQGPDAGLRLYQRARGRHVAVYQTLSWIFTPMYQSDSRVLPFLRDRVLMPVSRVPPVPAILKRIVSGDLVAPCRM